MTKISIDDYTPNPSDKFFFDNNIWMYLYCPLGNYNEYIISKYSNFFGAILDSNAKIYVSSLILSEFYNAYIKLDFNIWKGRDLKDFKRDYRPTERYEITNKTILNSIESRILGISQRINDEFTNIPIDKLSERIGKVDFNDSYYVELAIKHGLKIVTNDRDFVNISDNITILTLN